MELVGMTPINEFVETCLYTCLLETKCPVSCLLVGPSGGGKSRTVERWQAPWIHHTNDITSAGLSDLLAPDHDNKIRAVMLPDFNVPLSHKPNVVALTMANLLSLMSEGTLRIDDGRREKKITHDPVSFISAVTPDMYYRHHRKWKALGILRRFLTINYTYGLETRREGNRQIREQKITAGPLAGKLIKQNGRHSVLLEKEEAREVESLALELAKNISFNLTRDYKTGKTKWTPTQDVLEFSPHLTLQLIARAHALLQGRVRVAPCDISFLVKMVSFTNPSQPGVL